MFKQADDDRGQVGIGTLIVFIAMVLVAAIAAGVLINTAGFLQSSAEESGEQSASQVTNRLQVVSAVGSDISSNEVTTVELTVKRAPGADNVDLETVTAQWVDDSGTFNVVHTNTFASQDASFSTSTFRDDDSSISGSRVLNDPADRAVMTFNIGTGTEEIDTTMSEGTDATVTLNTQAGGETTQTLLVPESLSGKSAVTL
jgi:flagellin FlaB